MSNLQIPLPAVIPAITNTADLVAFLDSYADPWVMVKLGDINTLPNIVRRVHEKRKKIMVHHDSISGLSADRSGIRYLANMGVDAVNTTRLHCISTIQNEKMLAVLGLFIIDSSAVASAVRAVNENTPDFALLMPSSLPHRIIRQIKSETGCPLLGGGLCASTEELDLLLMAGLEGVTTSEKALWHIKSKED
ncbi:glycerol-3-phosphate responsive antiterminator [Eubacterium sp. 1001713B170207_170306_E7]|uniref:glycerol-3-phosphate responsive antiterminator n=1 Tax=Eubacterium sp. 1001713B170207_170306_E7 TaxID=2787097 RepID=UPI0018992B99